ncbi:MAG: hypothetical protein H7Y42_18585 [Chitinophagaceae bacterium]|nr:hypothetical protein [Chitinophagaceae bacterium]
MTVLVIADDAMRIELGQPIANSELQLTWADDFSPASMNEIDVCVDLLFDNSSERIHLLKQLSSAVVIINSVIDPLSGIDENFIRINAWPGFLKRALVEAAGENIRAKETAEKIFALFGKKMEWVPDIPGLISARVIVSIINEAWFANEEEVSTRNEIDIAMKLGTNYPYGPFDWCDKIGLVNVHRLLSMLASRQERYKPAASLEKAATA